MSIEQLCATNVELKTARFAGVYVVSASGELDLHTAPSLQAELFRVMDIGATRVVVDLLAAPFVDSAALGVFALVAKRMRVAGGELILVSDDPRILRVFQVTGLDKVFVLERSLAAAIDAAIAGANGGPP